MVIITTLQIYIFLAWLMWVILELKYVRLSNFFIIKKKIALTDAGS